MQIRGSKTIKWLPPGNHDMNHVREGAKCYFFFVCAEETGRVKNCLGECSLKVTCPDCSKILVSNPGIISLIKLFSQMGIFLEMFQDYHK